jgi:GR25 family glycosyltransferase involved in LPS biosynthesis
MSFSLHDVSIYYINLDSRKDRRENIEKRLSQFKIKYKRKSAVTPDKITIPFHQHAQHINNNEKGCTQSHIEIIKDFLGSEDKYLMIMEDDIRFRKDWMEVINKKLTTINQDDPEWHCLFLYTTEGIKHYSLSNQGIPMDEEDKKLFHTWRKIQEHYSTASMIFSKKGAQTFYSMFNEYTGYFKIDWMTWNLQLKGHCYGIFPWLMCIDGTQSSLNDKEGSDADFNKAMKLLKEADYSFDNYI